MVVNQSPVSLAPHLDRLLSLDQTRTFTFVGSPEDTGDPVYLLDVGGVDCVFSKKRSTCTYPIRVDTLVARFHDHGEDLLLAAGDVYGDVFSLFSPTHAVLSTLNSPKPGQDIPYVVLEHVDWDRLQSLSVSNLVWSQLLSSAPFLERLPRSSLTVIVELPDLIPLLAEPTDEWTLLDHMVYELKPWANAAGRPPEMLSSERPQVKELVVKVWSEGQKEEVLKAVLKGWDMTGTLCQEERDRREAMIGFVVVD